MKHNVAKCLDNRQPDVNKYLSAFRKKSEKSSFWFAANLSTAHATHMLSKTSAAESVTTFLSGGIKSRTPADGRALQLLSKLGKMAVEETPDTKSLCNSEEASAPSSGSMHRPTLTFPVTPPPANVCTKELHSRAEESAFNSSGSSEERESYSEPVLESARPKF